jgi:RNA polymerase sigma-70 factor (ECF subfamily)
MPVASSNAAIDQGPYPQDADRDLMARIAAGDASAFEQLIAEHRPRITRLVYRLLGWRGEVEDVVQDVFLIAYRKLPRFRGQSTLATWLAGIAINRCRAHRRRWTPSWRWIERFWRQRRPPPTPDEAAAADETAERVRQAVRQLPSADREVIVLYYLEELPAAELARLLGISPGAVDVRLHRARQKLREMLGDADAIV